MSKIKKLIALTLALAMVLSVSAFAGSYKADTYADADKINEDCESAVELLYALDIMVGDGKNFNPESAVTRAEMAKMIYVILNYGDDDKAVTYTGAKVFSDVPAGEWYEGYVNYCAATKLIAGRGDGKFDPTAPVTTAEAAKMLLTAIGYSAEARGYVGANWDKNVLSDAAILGLLDGYKANVNSYAPRQWVAVMFENMLLDCYTFGTMAPSFDGLLVSGSQYNVQGNFPKMGAKYYGLRDKTGYLIATDTAYIDGADVADSGYLTFIDGDDNTFSAKSSALGFEDLGQQYRVITNSTGKTIYSIRNTGKSIVDEAVLQDITAEVKYSTSGNRSNNKYVFTVGDVVAPFGNAVVYDNKDQAIEKRGAVKFLSTNNEEYFADGVFGWEILTASEAFALIGGNSNDLVKVIDRDGDGDIDYVLYIDYTYAVIDDADTSTKYGDFITAVDFAGNRITDLEGGARLYLADIIETDDELEYGNYIKAFINPDSEKLNVEVLDTAEVTYDKKSSKGVYTFSGEKYIFADEAFLTAADFDDDYAYEDEFILVYDGNLVVAVDEIDDSIAALEKINEQLAVVYDYRYLNDITFSNGKSESVYNIYYIDHNGDKQVAQYTLSNDIGTSSYWNGYLTGAQLKAKLDPNRDCGESAERNKGLFILHTESDKTVWCEEVTLEGLNASAKLLDGYEAAADLTFDADREYLKNGDTKVEIASDAKIFVRYGASKYKVCTVADLAGEDLHAYAQMLTKENSRGVKVMYAGFIDAQGLDVAADTGYLYLTEPEDGFTMVSKKYNTWNAMINFEGKEPVDAIVKLAAGEKPSEEALYEYSYDADDDVYTLEEIIASNDKRIEKLYKKLDEIEFKDGKTFNVEDKAIVLSEYTIDLRESKMTYIDLEDELYVIEEMIEDGTLEPEFEGIDFIDFQDMPEEVIWGSADATYSYFTLTYRTSEQTDDYDGLFYVVLVKVMFYAQ